MRGKFVAAGVLVLILSAFQAVAAALPMGANVFLFAQRYEVAEGLTTAAMGLSTVLALSVTPID